MYTSQIIQCLRNIKNFIGVFARDEYTVPREGIAIINTDVAGGEGIHWTCLIGRNGEFYFFDSYGRPPWLELQNTLQGYPVTYNIFSIQSDDSNVCGYYCIYIARNANNIDAAISEFTTIPFGWRWNDDTVVFRVGKICSKQQIGQSCTSRRCVINGL